MFEDKDSNRSQHRDNIEQSGFPTDDSPATTTLAGPSERPALISPYPALQKPVQLHNHHQHDRSSGLAYTPEHRVEIASSSSLGRPKPNDSPSRISSANVRAEAANLIVYADDNSYPAPSRSHRDNMDIAYRANSYPYPGFSDEHRQGRSSSQPHRMSHLDSASQSAAEFWPVPRPAQGYPGTVYADAHAEEQDSAIYGQALQIKREQPSHSSYIYDSGSPMLRHPIVYSQPPGQPHPPPWSDAGSSYSEYPTAPYIAQAHGMPHHAEQYHHHYSYGSYPDGDMSSNGGNVVPVGAHSGVREYYEGQEGPMWPLAASHIEAVGVTSPYAMPGEGDQMPGSPDKSKLKARTGLPLPLPKQFKCSACDAIFSRNHDLKRHARIHLAVKPFPCVWCDKAFSRKDALKRHVLVKGCGIGNKKGNDGRRKANGKSIKTEMQEFEVGSQDSSFESYSVRMTRKNSEGGGSVNMHDVQQFRNQSPYEQHHGSTAWFTGDMSQAQTQQYGEDYSSQSRQDANSEYETRTMRMEVALNSLADAYPPSEGRLAAYGMPVPSSFSDSAGTGSRPTSSQSDIKPVLSSSPFYYRNQSH